MFKLSYNSKNHRKGIDPRLIEISDLAIKLSLIDFGHGPYAGLRSAELQNALYLDKKSEADGYNDLSKHQSGLALDFYAYINGAASWEPVYLAMVATAFLQAASILGYRIQWGCLWAKETPSIYGWDMPHIQLLED